MNSSLCALLVLAAAASGQSTLTPTKVTAPIKDRGVYHLATGTWSRANASSSFNSDVLFNNTASTGYFFGTTSGFNTVDHGRIPSTSSPATPDSVVGTFDSYRIDCFQIGYCSSILASAGGVDIALTYYDDYAPCSDVDVGGGIGIAARFIVSGLAGATPAGAQGCWMVAFDLSNTTATFFLSGDADGAWDNVPNTDSFGWGLDFTNAIGGSTGNGTGPLIAGNCPVGGVTVPQRGFQTTFGGVPGATDSTGLGTNDFFWIDAPPLGCSMSTNGGCFFFGGCTTGTTGPAFNPFGGYWLQLFGDTVPEPPGTAFCSSITNASGSQAILRASGTDPNVDLTLTVTGLPNSTGQLFFGTMGFTTPGTAMLGDGPLCAAMAVVRINPFLSAGMMMQPPHAVSLALNYTAPYAASLTGTRFFQHWYRSTLSTGTGSNGSSGIKITF
ncbi:MAG: hypothetical protein ACI8QZ_003262 [Chlamydiales bacterium]|jgi:hypothetical protein